MKKIILATLAATALFTACDPAVDDLVMPEGTAVSGTELENGFKYTQFALTDAGYVAAADGNYIQFSTNPSAVVKIWINGADGSAQVLSAGTANGMFTLAPPRGSEPNQTVYITTRGMDGTEVTVSKVITVAVATELSKEMLLICSNDGQKVWQWDNSDGGAFWGNIGYTAGSGDDFADSRAGQWWGVTSTAEFADQQQHRGGDKVTGDDSTDATMVFSETGLVKCFDANGTEIRSGKFSIENYNIENKKVINDQAWSVGQLKTTAGSILWPYAINTNGMQPEEFEIVRLTSEQLILTYAAAGTGSWSEATYWRFRCTDGNAIAQNAPNGWTWDNDGTAFWGNMGYCGGKGEDVYANHNGQWWGITSTAGFADQQQHRGDDAVTGDDDENAYMIFGADNVVTSYDANGSQIRQAEYRFTPIQGNDWKVAEMSISGADGGILWPYEINSNGNKPSNYEVVYMKDGKMVLVYPDGGDFSTNGGWGEASFWRFKKK